MATTPNYGWTLPTVGGDTDAWGGELNNDLTGIDSTVFSVSGVANAAQTAANNAQTTANTANTTANAALPLAGGTMTGPLILSGDPTQPLGAVDKQYVDARPIIGDNRVINGDMRIDQRNNGASGTASYPTYMMDRWFYQGAQAGKGTWQRVGVACPGFPYALIFTSSSAYASVAADYFVFSQYIEADMISDLAWGTAYAQPVTLSFWVNSSLTGTFSGSLRNGATNNRGYPFSYSIPVAGTWTKITIAAIPGDTGGTWTLSGNTAAVNVSFDLGSGSNNRGPAGAWASTPYIGVTGAVSVVATNGANFSVTGVKLEIGSVATPFNRQSLTKSMADCQRYFQSFAVSSWGSMGFNTDTNREWTIYFPVQMRAAPTVTVSGNVSPITSSNINPGAFAANWAAGNATSAGAITSWTASAEL